MENQASFSVGDIVKVSQKILDGKKERVVSFKGKVVRIKGSGLNKMFVVRQNLEGVDVDRIFPFSSPVIVRIELIEKPKKRVRRASLLRIKSKN